jgi:hypothetical protein
MMLRSPWNRLSLFKFSTLLCLFLSFSAEAAKKKSKTKATCDEVFAGSYGLTTEEKLNLMGPRRGSLHDLNLHGPEESRALNETALKDLNAEKVLPSTRDTPVTAERLKEIYQTVSGLKSVKQSMSGKYRGSINWGFCFGRAMAAHMELLHSGVDNGRIKKIWAVGDLKSTSNTWRYHVSTLVRGDDGIWYAVDPIMYRLITVEEWHRKMDLDYNKEGTMRIYITPASRMFPGSFEKYTKREMKDEGYKGFFIDLMDEVYTSHTGKKGSWTPLKEARDLRVAKHERVYKMIKAVGGTAAVLWALHELKEIQKTEEEAAAKEKASVSP